MRGWTHEDVDDCDLMVAFWSGYYWVIRDAVDYARSIGKPVEVTDL